MSNPKPASISERQRVRLLKAASYASVTVALSLALLKLWAWRATGSVSLLGSLADSVLDVVASGLTFVAVRYSLAPADREHRFGHGKSEGLSALAQAMIIAASAFYVLWEAAARLLAPAPIRQPETGLAVMLVSIVASALLVGFQHHVGRRTGSVAIAADAMHYKADVIVNAGVALAILVSSFTRAGYVDAGVGVLVAAYILLGAWRIASRALDILLDREIPDAERERIKAIARRHPEVRGIHDLKTRFGGSHYIVQFHLELDPHMSLVRSHRILDEVERDIGKQFPGCEIIIHPDPLGYPEPREKFK